MFIALVSFYFSTHFCSNETQDFATRLVLGAAFIVQIASVILGVAGGLMAKNALAKGMAVVGLLLSLGLGFVTFTLLGVTIWGMGGC